MEKTEGVRKGLDLVTPEGVQHTGDAGMLSPVKMIYSDPPNCKIIKVYGLSH